MTHPCVVAAGYVWMVTLHTIWPHNLISNVLYLMMKTSQDQRVLVTSKQHNYSSVILTDCSTISWLEFDIQVASLLTGTADFVVVDREAKSLLAALVVAPLVPWWGSSLAPKFGNDSTCACSLGIWCGEFDWIDEVHNTNCWTVKSERKVCVTRSMFVNNILLFLLWSVIIWWVRMFFIWNVVGNLLQVQVYLARG